MTKRNEHIQGLRDLADWLESRPAAPVSALQELLVPIPMGTNSRVREVASELGTTEEYRNACEGEGDAFFDIKFGPITYHVYGYEDFDAHCAREEENRARSWASKNEMTIQPKDTHDF